jgi:hypothetical protein
MLKSVRALLVAAALAVASVPAAAADPRLYAIDCGRAEFADLAPFSDTGEYEGHPGTLMAACFLIRHPKGTLLWDAGLGDRYAGPEGTQLPSGYVLLSGDLFHTRANRSERRMPVFNVSRAETLAAMDRIERIVARLHARVVIQHDIEDFEALPKLPQYLD